MKRSFAARSSVNAALLGLLTLAGATSAPRLTLAQQAVKADVIVRATVQAPTSVQESGQTWTVYPLTILETLAGDAQGLPQSQDKPSVWVLGGLQDGPLLTGGETMLLLYKPRYDSPLVGFNQGFYPVQSAGSGKVVTNLPDGTPGVTLVVPAPGTPAEQSETVSTPPLLSATTNLAPASTAPSQPIPAQPALAQPTSTRPVSTQPSPAQPSSTQPGPLPVTAPALATAAATPPAAPLPPTALDESASVSATAAATPAATSVLAVPAAPALPATSSAPASPLSTPAATLPVPASSPPIGSPAPAQASTPQPRAASVPATPAPPLAPVPVAAPAAPLPGQMSLETFRKTVLDARAKAGK